jgi:hypothetical protein
MNCSAGRRRPVRKAEGLRGRIAQLAERLAGVEGRLSRLVITRETVEEVLNGSGAEASPATIIPDGAAASRSGHLAAVGVLAVPPWRAGLAVSALPEAYRDLVEVVQDAGRPLRAVHIAAAAGLSTDKAKVEGLRSKLKRLAERGWLTEEAGLGLFGCRRATVPGKRQNRGDSGLFFLGSKVPTRTNRTGRRAPWNRMPRSGMLTPSLPR